MYYVYLIESSVKKWHYIGYTDSLINRLKKHNTGGVRSTKPYIPFRLIYFEAYQEEIIARKREIELKRNSQQRELLYKKLKI